MSSNPDKTGHEPPNPVEAGQDRDMTTVETDHIESSLPKKEEGRDAHVVCGFCHLGLPRR
ncbi:hypothetical protein OROGR_025482 [Orobanche gracilis]